MHIDPSLIKPGDSYKLLTSLVIPRPIAWVTSMNEHGLVNLAPFSFFNAISGNPLYVMVSVGLDGDERKDTAANVLRSGEFVVHLVTEELMDAMTVSAADFPPEMSELNAAGLTSAPSLKIAVPRIAEAQAGLECKLHSTLALGENTVLIGEVVMFHVADHLVGPRFYINGFTPIGRLGGRALYCRTTERFEWPRIGYAEWRTRASKSDVSE